MKLEFAFQPKQKQFLKSVEGTPVTFYGGARGGGKSRGLRDILILRRFQHPKTHGALFRRTYKELDGNHIRPMLKERPELKEFWSESKKLLTLPNGSTLEFCHCEGEKDVTLYQGREFDDLGIEEAGQWTEQMFKTLLGSNRSSQKGFRPRCMLTGNPGGVGHAWLKRLFVQRKFKPNERPQDYAFVQALVADNPALLENDPDYVHRLNAEPNEALRKAYLYGDWDIFAGQFFGELRREVHVIPDFRIPIHWNRFGAYDFGFNHPGSFGWFAVDEDGNVYLYREFVKAGLRVDQFAKSLNQFDDTASLYPIVAGRDCWTVKNVLKDNAQPPTIAEEFATHGINLKPANIDRIQGAAQLRSYLAWQDKGHQGGPGKPRLFIFESCPVTYDCISRMIIDPDRPEDVLKVDATDGDPYTGDDAYDMIRYGLMTRPMLSEAPKKQLVYGTAEYNQAMNEDAWEREREKLIAEADETGGQWPSMPGFGEF